jgi:hypothetical protein
VCEQSSLTSPHLVPWKPLQPSSICSIFVLGFGRPAVLVQCGKTCCSSPNTQQVLFFQLWSSVYCPRLLLLAALQSACLVRCLDSFTGSLGLGQFSCTGNWLRLHLAVVIAVACSQRHFGSSLSSASKDSVFLACDLLVKIVAG